MIEPQWPALSTVSGAISVPVHRKPLAMMTSATDGNSPGPALVPPTIAIDGRRGERERGAGGRDQRE